jgi:hypothetical protein
MHSKCNGESKLTTCKTGGFVLPGQVKQPGRAWARRQSRKHESAIVSFCDFVLPRGFQAKHKDITSKGYKNQHH